MRMPYYYNSAKMMNIDEYITINDLRKINIKYELRWTEEDMMSCFNSVHGLYKFLDLPVCFEKQEKVLKELYYLYEKRKK